MWSTIATWVKLLLYFIPYGSSDSAYAFPTPDGNELNCLTGGGYSTIGGIKQHIVDFPSVTTHT